MEAKYFLISMEKELANRLLTEGEQGRALAMDRAAWEIMLTEWEKFANKFEEATRTKRNMIVIKREWNTIYKDHINNVNNNHCK